MLEYIGCWIIISLASVTWLKFEMLIADLGPLYDEQYRPIANT